MFTSELNWGRFFNDDHDSGKGLPLRHSGRLTADDTHEWAMLIKELQNLQHHHGYLPREALHELAERLKIPLFEVYGVASFYPHFRLEAPTGTEIKVCTDLSCHLAGARSMAAAWREACGATELSGRMSIGETSCLGRCDAPVAYAVNEQIYRGGSPAAIATLMQSLRAGQLPPRQPLPSSPDNLQIDPYCAVQPFEALRQLVERRHFSDIIATLKASGLRGMGGAGFPAGVKWEIVRNVPGDTKYVVCNADESEPGTFKDRMLLHTVPELVLEGMILGALTVGARHGYVYIRHEYAQEREVLDGVLQKMQRDGLVGERILGSELDVTIEIFDSPGGYICGEETALLEALEGKRAEPRNKPPFPGTSGLSGKPTLINNVETFAFVPAILLRGAEWFKSHGQNNAAGLKFLALSGHVQRPGVYEVALGLPAAQLIFDYGGGVVDGRSLKAFSPGGASSGFLPASMVDTPLDFQALAQVGSMLGSGAVVVVADGVCMLDLALNVVRFFRNESCGKCVPCRTGSEKLVQTLTRISREGGSSGDLDTIHALAEAMQLTSICGLGQAAPLPITSVIRYFGDEIERHVYQRECPAGVCFR
ncbi:MAG TPA: NADH-ubiquinone oxidoreductase-F iron-sulfur binding region domain-containing protein [Candidatus Tectomicrobia bacterium]|nr:NADH-ubiquinone oxidoreductase-F iron-sulfur binding region domain-containing protein [Candidatus Tectomicrobia bacterium]